MALRKLVFTLIGSFALLSLPMRATADVALDPAKEAEAQALFADIMSPYCVARSLRDCPSSAAHDLQDEIRGKLATGQTSQSIMQDLLAKFGQKIRATPEKSGFGLLGWLTPIAFAILGMIILALRFRHIKESAPAPEAKGVDPEMEKRINEELSKF
ncbi:MAG: cytochrome c-type biogenesis protein CcmH [Deltaproteobacteria bacterium]|nr:cytochrome c-type biogenesis protein CcmH [Deltaproteobacteria bacterium]